MITEVLFDMFPGSLVVYTIKRAQDEPISTFYWKDAASPQGWGPFRSIGDCMDHYKLTVGITLRPEVPDNLVRVDFVGKRRV